MKVTLPNGTTVEGTREELAEYLPPPPQYNYDGSPKLMATVGTPIMAGVDMASGHDDTVIGKIEDGKCVPVSAIDGRIDGGLQ